MADKSGLSAAPRSNLYMLDPANVVIPGLDNDTKPDDVDGLYDERIKEPVPKWLIDSVYAEGVLEPVIVRSGDDSIDVVAGQFRIRAAREANKRLKKEGKTEHRVPCLNRKGDTAALYAAKISENELRTADSPMNRALKAERYITILKKTPVEAALAFGVTVQTISSWRQILKAVPEVQKALESGKIASTSAAKIATLKTPEEQQTALAELVALNKPSVEQAAHVVGKTKAAKAGKEANVASARPRRVLRKLVDAQVKGTIELPKPVYDALRWALGKVSSRGVEGLGPALRLLKLEE